MTTIRKTSKEFKEVIALNNWKMFDLYFGFKAQEIENIRVTENMKVQKYDGKYVVTIHSNLWYEKSIN